MDPGPCFPSPENMYHTALGASLGNHIQLSAEQTSALRMYCAFIHVKAEKLGGGGIHTFSPMPTKHKAYLG